MLRMRCQAGRPVRLVLSLTPSSSGVSGSCSISSWDQGGSVVHGKLQQRCGFWVGRAVLEHIRCQSPSETLREMQAGAGRPPVSASTP